MEFIQLDCQAKGKVKVIMLKSISFLCVISIVQFTAAAVTPMGIFSDSMVLQRDLKVPIWGWATVGEQVTVTFNGQTVQATARDSSAAAYKGYWKALLQPMSSGGPFDMTITGSASTAITFKNILIGDVWVCSGQSNMDYTMSDSYHGEGSAEVAMLPPAGQPNTKIRICRVGHNMAVNPTLDLQPINQWNQYVGAGQITAPWRSLSHETGQYMSETGAIFISLIYKQYPTIPVGLICAPMGSTPVMDWISGESADDYYNKNACGSTAPPSQPRTPVRFNSSQSQSTVPAVCYSGMIYPIGGFGIKGAIWWQGETDAIQGPICYYQKAGMRRLIQDWRARWGQGDFPFITIQLQSQVGSAPGINIVHDSHLQSLDEPNAGLAVIFDSASGDHPAGNRIMAAQRTVLAARMVAYGENITGMGPIYKSMAIESNKIRIQFAYVGSGLVKHAIPWWQGDNNLAVGATVLSSSADSNSPFEIAGADNVFHKADAVIDNNAVLVSSPAESAPQNVHYCLEGPNRAKTVLYNDANLPASMFMTDTWAGMGNGSTVLNRTAASRFNGMIAVGKAFKMIGNGAALTRALANQEKPVEFYDVNGKLIRLTAATQDGTVKIHRNKISRHLLIAKIKE
jgi:sialate O-acetylesterase